MLCVTIGGGGRSHECHLCSGVLGPAELIRIEDELELSGKSEADAVVPDVAVALNAASTLTTAAQAAALAAHWQAMLLGRRRLRQECSIAVHRQASLSVLSVVP